MDMTDLKNKSESDLHRLLEETSGECARLRFRAAERRLKDVRALREARQIIARIRTLLSQKSL